MTKTADPLHTRFVDVHCHLENSAFDHDRDSVIQRARANGILIITSATSVEEYSHAAQIADAHDNVYLSLGLDPVRFTDVDVALEELVKFQDRFVAIGEVGLDHFKTRDHSERNLQADAFKKMIAYAKEMCKPIQVHSRSAGRAALDVLKSEDADGVHMHAFDGRASLARVASNELGYYFSIPTSVVRSPQKRKLVKAVAFERLLLETDSPVLGPQREERNEPMNIEFALKETASILKRDTEELREIVLENTLRLYRDLE
ncbi:MAG: TatD family hydrolase [Candidatus Thorarchaeota archaeon]